MKKFMVVLLCAVFIILMLAFILFKSEVIVSEPIKQNNQAAIALNSDTLSIIIKKDGQVVIDVDGRGYKEANLKSNESDLSDFQNAVSKVQGTDAGKQIILRVANDAPYASIKEVMNQLNQVNENNYMIISNISK